MRSRITKLNPFLILLAVAMASILFVVACGGGSEATAVPQAVEEVEEVEVPDQGEVAQVPDVVEEVEVVEEAMEEGGPKRGGTLTMALYTEHTTLDPPAVGISVMDIAITQATYDNLLMIQPDLTMKPELALSWEANDDLTAYTFYLREGVKFHHGKDFKAEDVVSTFKRIQDPVLDVPIRPTFEVIEEVVIIDDYTVRFDLDGPNGFFVDSLSVYQARIVPSDVDVRRLHTEEFGTGPFMIEEHIIGERTTMVRNPNYWEEGKPYLDEFVVQFIPEAATRAEALKSGDVDLVYQLEPQSIPGLESHPDTTVLNVPSLSIIGMDMRNDMAPFDNKLVRQAMQAATDREAIVQAALFGLGEVALDHLVPDSDPRYAPQHQPLEYNPELARELLAEAGYPDGIDIVLHTADVGAGMIEMAVAFKESAAPAGIRVELKRGNPANFFEDVWMEEPFVVVYWYGRANVDQSHSIQYLSDSSWNGSFWLHEEFDSLVLRARGETLEEQIVTYGRIQEILVDEVPRLVVGYQPWLYGVRANLRGVIPHPLGWPLINDAWIDQ